MVSAAFTSADLVIIAATAIAGGLVIDLNRRLPTRLLLGAGAAMVLIGWIVTLTMTSSGPYPHATGAAIGSGLFLAGIALLLPAARRTLRTRRTTERDRNMR